MVNSNMQTKSVENYSTYLCDSKKCKTLFFKNENPNSRKLC